MRQSYSLWLASESFACHRALLGLILERDRLRYVEAQSLRREYMSKIGVFEEQVLEQELKVELQKEKIALVQAAINMREDIDLLMIEDLLEEKRNELLFELERRDLTVDPAPELLKPEKEEMQKLYHDIVRDFHPFTAIGQTDTQKELYQKAQSAYQAQNLDALRVIHRMLYDVKDMEEQPQPQDTSATAEEEAEKLKGFLDALGEQLNTDYTLAAELYPMFLPTEADMGFQNTITTAKERMRKTESEIAAIRAAFPFTAKETMQDEKKTQEYLTELNVRLKQAHVEMAALESRLQEMIGASQHG